MKSPFIQAVGWALMAMITVFVTLIALASIMLIANSGGAEVDRTIGVLGLPLFSIQVSHDGFSITNQIGTMIVPLTAGLVTFVTALAVRRWPTRG